MNSADKLETTESSLNINVRRRPRKVKISLSSRNSRRISRAVRRRVSSKVSRPKVDENSQSKPYACQVEKCKYAGAKEGYLNRHMLRHEKEKLYPCKLCPKRFLTLKSLNEHVFSHDNEIDVSNVEKGDISEKSTQEKTSKVQKDRSGMYTCHYCSKKFRLKYKLQEHIEVHEQN